MSQAPRTGRIIRVPLPGAALVPGDLPLPAATAHYLVSVLRLPAGAPLVLFDGAGAEADAVLKAEAGGWCATITEPARAGVGSGPVTLVYGLPKGDKLDAVVRQVTEIGVARIVLLAASRSVVKLAAERADKRLDRLSRITAEAARQSGRADTPELAGPVDLAGALALTEDCAARIILEPTGAVSLSSLPAVGPWALFVGPEGGFDPNEISKLQAAGAHAVRLGATVLRTETAAPVACALALQHLGWW